MVIGEQPNKEMTLAELNQTAQEIANALGNLEPDCLLKIYALVTAPETTSCTAAKAVETTIVS